MHRALPDDWLEDALGPGKPGSLGAPLSGSPTIRQFDVTYRRYFASTPPNPKRYMRKGGSCVWPLDGGVPEPSCNEIEVVKRLVDARPDRLAYFYSTFANEPEWDEWVKPLAQMPRWLTELDDELREQPGGPGYSEKRRGLPDVAGWDPKAPDPLASAVFVECKANDSLSDDQMRWFATAIRLGKVPEGCLGLAQGRIYRF